MRCIVNRSKLLLMAFWLLIPHAFCAGLPSGKIVWWGNDFFTECGFRDTNGIIRCDHDILRNVVAVAGKLALKNDGTVFSFEDDPNGAHKVAGLSNVVSIAAEGGSSWAIRRDGTVARWGGTKDEANVVACLTNITSVACGSSQLCFALRKDGVVLAFRLDDRQPLIQPVTVGSQVLSNVVAIASMEFSLVVLKKTGEVLSLGYQTPGLPPVKPHYERHGDEIYTTLDLQDAQLPFKYTTADPIIVNGNVLSNVIAIASGWKNHLALKSNGTVIAWDNDIYGAVKNATKVNSLSNVTAIAASWYENLALKSDGTVVSWDAANVKQAALPAGLSNVIAIAANSAITTGNAPPGIHIKPHGRLEDMQVKADLVFKGQVLGSTLITNNAFQVKAKVAATQFKVISVLQGTLQTNVITLEHYASEPETGWIGQPPPAFYRFKARQSYLVFAANLDKPDVYYSPAPGTTNSPDVFRQIADVPKNDDDGAIVLTGLIDGTLYPHFYGEK